MHYGRPAVSTTAAHMAQFEAAYAQSAKPTSTGSRRTSIVYTNDASSTYTGRKASSTMSSNSDKSTMSRMMDKARTKLSSRPVDADSLYEDDVLAEKYRAAQEYRAQQAAEKQRQAVQEQTRTHHRRVANGAYRHLLK